jgi:hypothetical protein
VNGIDEFSLRSHNNLWRSVSSTYFYNFPVLYPDLFKKDTLESPPGGARGAFRQKK